MELKFRDLMPEEIEVRVGQVINTDKFKGVTLLLYKNARVDMDILDETVGAMNWQRSHSRDNANCSVGIWDSEKQQWVWKEDTGTESNTEAEKGLASDSFKRVCVNWGIGRKLYTRLNLITDCELDAKNRPIGTWEVEDISYDAKKITGIKVVHKNKKGEVDKVVCDTVKITNDQKIMFDELCVKVEGVLRKFNVKTIDELTKSQANWVIAKKVESNEN